MTRLAYILAILFLAVHYISQGQTIEKKFTGQWATTLWTFEFHKDSSYTRTSSGHFGNVTFKGKYKIINDTIELLNGFENSSGTLNKYYLMNDNFSIYGTRTTGRIIDLTNLYEYYDNDHFYTSKKNKIRNVTITGDSSNSIKSFVAYFPIDPFSAKTDIQLGFCVDFFDYPVNLKKAYLDKPDIKNEKDGIFLYNLFDEDGKLTEHFYFGSLVSGVKPLTMKLEYFTGSSKVKKITDSKDNSVYIFDYDNEGNIYQINHFSENNKIIDSLKIL